MLYILGIITGLIISVIVLLTLIYLKTPLERKINSLISKNSSKGRVIENTDEEVDSWINKLPNE